MDEKIAFIINPVAGKKRYSQPILSSIGEYSMGRSNVEVYYTKARQDATDIARRLAQSGEKIRIFACGGDGTLNEVLNGIVGHNNVELGCIPAGSGNDFIKTFGRKEDFLNIESQVNGHTKRIDIIKSNDMYAINICSIGLDAKIGANMIRFKKIPLVTGALAYNLSIFYCLFSKISTNITIKIDDNEEISGEYVFALAANGRYYGGSYMGAPFALYDDGLLDFVLVKTVSRLKVAEFLNRYSKGTHLDLDYVSWFRGKKMVLTANDRKAYLNADGECTSVSKAVFEIVPAIVDFIVPEHIC